MGSNAIPRFLKYIFPASTNTEIALVQSLVAAGSMLLNGSYADLTGINPNVSIINNGFSSVVSLTSTQNNAGVNFTINGYQNGVPVTETIVGPNNNTTPTTIIFDIVTSITTDAAIDQVSVGIGNMGFFNIIQTDPNVMSPVYTFQMQWLVDGVTGHGYISADNVINNGLTYQTMITNIPLSPLFELGATQGGIVGDFMQPRIFTYSNQLLNLIFYIVRTANQPITLVYTST